MADKQYIAHKVKTDLFGRLGGCDCPTVLGHVNKVLPDEVDDPRCGCVCGCCCRCGSIFLTCEVNDPGGVGGHVAGILCSETKSVQKKDT